MVQVSLSGEMEKEISDLKTKFIETFDDLKQYHNASEKSKLVETCSIWHEVYNKKVRVYSSLSEHFFNINALAIDEEVQAVEIFLININFLKDIAKDRDMDQGFYDFIEKIRDHIELIGIQVNRMDTGVKKANEIKEKLTEDIILLKGEIEIKKKEFDDLSESISQLMKKQNVAVKKAKKVQKEFVTILGIFATILITTFGGLTSLASIFNNINNAGTGKLILLGSFVIFTILLIVFLLLNGISKLSELNIRSCGCEVNSQCNCPISKKHPTLYIVTTILIMTSLLGISEYIIDYQSLFEGVNNLALLVALAVGLILVLTLAVTYYHGENK